MIDAWRTFSDPDQHSRFIDESRYVHAPFAHNAIPQAQADVLHERKWLAWLGVAVALYQDPAIVIGNFVAPTSAAWGLASEISISIAVAVFFVVALCIADGLGRDRAGGRGHLSFYAPKVRQTYASAHRLCHLHGRASVRRSTYVCCLRLLTVRHLLCIATPDCFFHTLSHLFGLYFARLLHPQLHRWHSEQ